MNASPLAPNAPAERHYLNPVLVKELRQGVRSKLYAVVFLAIQVVMLMYLLLLTAKQETRSNSDVEHLFWWLISLFLLVCLPLSGANALSTETRGARLELLLLTGTSARRIVYGKWLAIVAQGALLIVSLLPYIVLRYYIDSAEFHESLVSILLLLCGCAVLTGISVSLSAIRTAILRWFLLVFGSIFIVPVILGNLIMQFHSLDMLYPDLPALLLTGLLLVFLCMEFAATRFNIIEQNHDTAKRLLLWALYGVALYSIFRNPHLELPYHAMLACFAMVAWDALCRPPSASPSIYEPFVKLGWFGRLAGRLFYPGWPSAVSFCLLTLLLVALPRLHHIANENWEAHWDQAWYIVLCIGVYALPFALALYIPLGRCRIGLSILFFQLVFIILTVFLFLIDEASGLQTTTALCWVPTSALQLEWMDEAVSDPLNPLNSALLVGSSITTLVAVLLILLKGIQQRRFIRGMEAKALENLRVRATDSAEQTVASPAPPNAAPPTAAHHPT